MTLSVNRSVTCVALTEIVFQNSEYFRPEHVLNGGENPARHVAPWANIPRFLQQRGFLLLMGLWVLTLRGTHKDGHCRSGLPPSDSGKGGGGCFLEIFGYWDGRNGVID